MGAMLGKEWLQSFDRSGQAGPSEEQGRFRQRKFNSIQQWHLEGTILFLPNLLLFSVTLFFAGLSLYLSPINRVIAGLLIAVLGLAVGFWHVSVLAGAIWPLCPYQSAASRAVRLLGLRTSSLWTRLRRLGGHPRRTPAEVKDAMFARVRSCKAHLLQIPSLTLGSWNLFPRFVKSRGNSERNIGNIAMVTQEHISTTQAIGWLIETTSNRDDLLAVAEFIITFDHLSCMSVLQDREVWQRFSSLGMRRL